MNFIRRLLCWKKKRNVAVTPSDIATPAFVIWEDDAENNKEITELRATVRALKAKIATLERLVEKQDHHNGSKYETTAGMGKENIFPKRTLGPGKCAHLRRVRRMEKTEYIGKCFGLATIIEEEEPTQSDT
jgi:hypothetical protein